MSNIQIYNLDDGSTQIEVNFDIDTVWLNRQQLSELFGRDIKTIGKHLTNVFKEGELEKNSVVAKFATTASDGKTYQIEHYNLDVIISIGYRVKSLQGTQFRIWATNVLRDHLVKGYTRNERRLNELKQSISLVQNVLDKQNVSSNEASALLRVVTDYKFALDLLDDYDHQRVKILNKTERTAQSISYDEAMTFINTLKHEFKESVHFGIEKDESLKGSLGAIVQAFSGKDVYPSLDEKAANLLYFLVKNHSFVDGNKRIAAALFLRFMEINSYLYREDGSKRLADTTLVAITLMIAESKPAEKDMITAMVVNLVNDRTLIE